MIRIKPIDMAFLLLENPSRSLHMCAFMLFDPPRGQEQTFAARVVDTYRKSQVARPFNYKLKWLGKGLAAWETVEPDMNFHIRHIAIPRPGSMEQFYDTISFLNSTLLDRGHPLWECYVVEGLENNRVAVMVKVHHSMIDGEGGLRAFRNSMSDSVRDKSIRGPWMPFGAEGKPRRAPPTSTPMQTLLKRLSRLPGNLAGFGSEAVNLGAQSLNLKPRAGSLPFTARRTLFNNIAQSGARRYANTELPLDEIKSLAKATGTSVNDVVMALVDDALHHYLREHGQATDRPLVAFMPMSLREEGAEDGGNQVSAELIAMGEPAANITRRLQQIQASTQRAKEKGRGLKRTVREVYALLLMGSLTLGDTLPVFGKVPSANLVISNMKGPGEQLFMGGAQLVAFHGLPILPPGAGLNVTFASVHKDLCLGIGASPEAVNEPFRLTQLIHQSLGKLQAAVAGKAAKPRPAAPRKPAKPPKTKATRRIP